MPSVFLFQAILLYWNSVALPVVVDIVARVVVSRPIGPSSVLYPPYKSGRTPCPHGLLTASERSLKMPPFTSEQAYTSSQHHSAHFGRSPSQSSDDAAGSETHFENASDIAELKAGLSLTPKHIPCGYLYDDRGSQLYDDITKLEEYYPFETEKELLLQHASAIVSSIPAGSIVVELGCGTAEKTSILLHALMARYCSLLSALLAWSIPYQSKLLYLHHCLLTLVSIMLRIGQTYMSCFA